ncbi:hypothetical protein ACFQDE_18770 [Deinococcus caeni]|uniref:hypothetical protein n=1 Tax=Deinococcus caeni TaxID=569127 RepID=UPI00361CA84F
MKKFILSATLLSVALPAALPAALAQATQTRAPAATGTDVLKAILKAKGLVLTDAQVAAILAGLQPGSASAGPYAALLGISPESLTSLLSAKTAPVPAAVALKAVLEAARPAPAPARRPNPSASPPSSSCWPATPACSPALSTPSPDSWPTRSPPAPSPTAPKSSPTLPSRPAAAATDPHARLNPHAAPDRGGVFMPTSPSPSSARW